MSEFIIAKRIVLSKNTEYEKQLLVENERQITTNSQNGTKIFSGGYVIIDFGKELIGGISITVANIGNGYGKCRIVFGESVAETMSTIGYKNATNDHAVRDMVVDMTSLSNARFGNTGFRFVKIEPIETEIVISALYAESDMLLLPYKGSFSCSDELLNKIWQVGAYTVNLNINDYIWDGIKRDRLVWAGDLHPEISVVNTVFGNIDSTYNSVNFLKKTNSSKDFMNTFLSYSMWWIIIQWELFQRWNNREFLLENVNYIKDILLKVFSLIDEDFNSLHDVDFAFFIDWNSRNNNMEYYGSKAIVRLALVASKNIFLTIDDKEFFEKCEIYINKLKVDTYSNNENKGVAALRVLADFKDENDKKLISGDSSEYFSTFMGYYILLAKNKLGQMDECLKIIKEYWGGMLKMGATTFWEDFNISWMKNSSAIDEIPADNKNDIHGDFGKFCYKGYRHSLCHGWASGPTAFLSECIAGIEILEPGCKKVRISPQLGGLEWANIDYPTPYGEIKISIKKDNGKVKTFVENPKEIEVIIG